MKLATDVVHSLTDRLPLPPQLLGLQYQQLGIRLPILLRHVWLPSTASIIIAANTAISQPRIHLIQYRSLLW